MHGIKVLMAKNFIDNLSEETKKGMLEKAEQSIYPSFAPIGYKLRAKALLINAAEPQHFVFPWHGREQKIDASRPLTSWRSAWRSIRRQAATNNEGEVIYPNLLTVRFHDLRHTAVTTMAEKGLPDLMIMAQVGHVAPQMLKHYSHIRRQALNAAAAALEPTFITPRAQPNATELVN